MTIHHCSRAQLFPLKFIQRREIVFRLFVFYWWWIISGLIISLLSAPTRATGGWIKNEKSTKSLTGIVWGITTIGHIHIFFSASVALFTLSVWVRSKCCMLEEKTPTLAASNSEWLNIRYRKSLLDWKETTQLATLLCGNCEMQIGRRRCLRASQRTKNKTNCELLQKNTLYFSQLSRGN